MLPKLTIHPKPSTAHLLSRIPGFRNRSGWLSCNPPGIAPWWRNAASPFLRKSRRATLHARKSICSRCRDFHVERARQVQRLDLLHPGEGQLIVGPVSLRDDRHLVFAGAFERPIIMGSDILDYREWIIPGIDNAFEEGHAVSTLPLLVSDTMVLTHAAGQYALA